jgi:antitoxin ParD1/3/4
MATRNIELTEHHEIVVSDLVRAGRYKSANDVINEGIQLIEEREAKLRALQDTLRSSIDAGGAHSATEVRAAVKERLDEWERVRNTR